MTDHKPMTDERISVIRGFTGNAKIKTGERVLIAECLDEIERLKAKQPEFVTQIDRLNTAIINDSLMIHDLRQEIERLKKENSEARGQSAKMQGWLIETCMAIAAPGIRISPEIQDWLDKVSAIAGVAPITLPVIRESRTTDLNPPTSKCASCSEPAVNNGVCESCAAISRMQAEAGV